MTTGLSVPGSQQLATASGGLSSFTISTNAAAKGLLGLIGRWSLQVEVANSALGNPWVEIAWGNLYAGGTSYAPAAPPVLTVSNWQIICNWQTAGISWECDTVLFPGMSGLQGATGDPGPAGPSFLPSQGPVTIMGNTNLAVDTHYDVPTTGHTLTFPDPQTNLGKVIGIFRPAGAINVTLLSANVSNPYFYSLRNFQSPANFDYNASTQYSAYALFIARYIGGLYVWAIWDISYTNA